VHGPPTHLRARASGFVLRMLGCPATSRHAAHDDSCSDSDSCCLCVEGGGGVTCGHRGVCASGQGRQRNSDTGCTRTRHAVPTRCVHKQAQTHMHPPAAQRARVRAGTWPAGRAAAPRGAAACPQPQAAAWPAPACAPAGVTHAARPHAVCVCVCVCFGGRGAGGGGGGPPPPPPPPPPGKPVRASAVLGCTPAS
jgi:hypothetical protein